jgi:hypothetical protein
LKGGRGITFYINQNRTIPVQPPGGLPSGAMSSRQVIQMISHRDKKRFQTSVPGK